jgi:hypothetical protein
MFSARPEMKAPPMTSRTSETPLERGDAVNLAHNVVGDCAKIPSEKGIAKLAWAVIRMDLHIAHIERALSKANECRERAEQENEALAGLLESAMNVERGLEKYLRTLPQERYVAEAANALKFHIEQVADALKGRTK